MWVKCFQALKTSMTSHVMVTFTDYYMACEQAGYGYYYFIISLVELFMLLCLVYNEFTALTGKFWVAICVE